MVGVVDGVAEVSNKTTKHKVIEQTISETIEGRGNAKREGDLPMDIKTLGAEGESN